MESGAEYRPPTLPTDPETASSWRDAFRQLGTIVRHYHTSFHIQPPYNILAVCTGDAAGVVWTPSEIEQILASMRVRNDSEIAQLYIRLVSVWPAFARHRPALLYTRLVDSIYHTSTEWKR